MPRKDHTEIVCIIDRSGSMEAIRTDAIGGFNAFLNKQKEEKGTTSVSLVLFDDQYEVPFQNIDLRFVAPLTDRTFVPRGTTALLDAVGRTVNDTAARLADMNENDRPERVIVCILTDGLENASKEFKLDKIKQMIDEKRSKDEWEFTFLAANQDAFEEGGKMGIAHQYIMKFDATGEGTQEAYKKMNMMTSEIRKRPHKKQN